MSYFAIRVCMPEFVNLSSFYFNRQMLRLLTCLSIRVTLTTWALVITAINYTKSTIFWSSNLNPNGKARRITLLPSYSWKIFNCARTHWRFRKFTLWLHPTQSPNSTQIQARDCYSGYPRYLSCRTTRHSEYW